MRRWFAALAVAGLLASATQSLASPCEVPAYLQVSESKLPRVVAAAAAKKLDVLVIGTRSTVIGASGWTTAYPGELERRLREKLPGVDVKMTVELKPKRTAEELLPELGKLTKQHHASLVIWQTGTVDAMRGVDEADFRDALDRGVELIQQADADVILLNLQYSPRTETMINGSVYIDTIRVIAQQHDVPVFDRFAIMRGLHETGQFDLFSPPPEVDFARKVHACLGSALSTFIIDSAPLKIGSSENSR